MSANDGRLAASGEGVVMPRTLTAENGAKAALMGEFSVPYKVHCHACDGDTDDCAVCDGTDEITVPVPITWTAIKAIYAAAVKHFHPEASQ